MTIREALAAAAAELHDAGIAEPRREAVSLLSLATGRDNVFFIANPDHTLDAGSLGKFNKLVARRSAREPLQYIRGHQEFYGLDFEVTPDVLIPRPETELVVENALTLLKDVAVPKICDVGTGSGCIIISILHELPLSAGTGLDVSEKALAVARRNAEKHGVAKRLELIRSDVFQDLPQQRFDLIVSNPPYVPIRDIGTLQPEVRDFEPHTALTDNAGGLSIISRIIKDAPRFLKPGGSLLMEIGFSQSPSVAAIFGPDIWRPPEFLPDLQGIPRIVKATVVS